MSNISWLAKFGDLLALPVEDHAADPSRSSYERFAIPHTFKPQLSVAQATVAAGGALLRIVLGSLLFAVWGAYTFLAWNALPNVFLRGLMALVSVTLFLVLLAGLMIAISALTRMIWPQRQRTTA